jgi:hypothetical protein
MVIFLFIPLMAVCFVQGRRANLWFWVTYHRILKDSPATGAMKAYWFSLLLGYSRDARAEDPAASLAMRESIALWPHKLAPFTYVLRTFSAGGVAIFVLRFLEAAVMASLK